jgi:hypothetical protein
MSRLATFITVDSLPTARRVALLGAVLPRAARRGLPVGALEAALRQEQELLDTERGWDASQGRGEAKDIDDAIDAALSALAEAATEEERVRLFPQGVSHHTSLPFTEQAGANRRVLELLADMPRLAEHRAALAPLQAEFEGLMLTADGVQFAEVRDMRAASREAFARALIGAVGAAVAVGETALQDVFAPVEEALDELDRAARAVRRQQRAART